MFLNLSLYECSRGAIITAIYKFVIKFIIVIHEAIWNEQESQVYVSYTEIRPLID